MTSPALQAAAILRDGQECARLAREAWDNGTNDREYVKEVCNAIDEALTLLEGEQSRVPEDRERLARQFTDAATIAASGRMCEAAALIRLPASMEVEIFDALHIESLINEWFAPLGFKIKQSHIDGLCEVLRRRLRRLFPATGSPSGAEEMRERAAEVADVYSGGPCADNGRMIARAIRALPVEPETKGEWLPIESVTFPPESTSGRYLLCDNYDNVVTGYWQRGHWYSDKAGYCPLGAHFVWLMPLPAPPADLPAQETKA